MKTGICFGSQVVTIGAWCVSTRIITSTIRRPVSLPFLRSRQAMSEFLLRFLTTSTGPRTVTFTCFCVSSESLTSYRSLMGISTLMGISWNSLVSCMREATAISSIAFFSLSSLRVLFKYRKRRSARPRAPTLRQMSVRKVRLFFLFSGISAPCLIKATFLPEALQEEQLQTQEESTDL